MIDVQHGLLKCSRCGGFEIESLIFAAKCADEPYLIKHKCVNDCHKPMMIKPSKIETPKNDVQEQVVFSS
jgi:hypothetical protein